MAATAISVRNDSEQNQSSYSMSGVNEISSSMVEDSATVDSNDIEETPRKKYKSLSDDKSRLLEDRLGSILSCCICMELSTLAMFQVRSLN